MSAVRAEWLKLRTAPSTLVVTVLVLVLGVGVGVLDLLGVTASWPAMSAQQRGAFDAVAASLDGLQYAQLGFAVLGVLAASSEYTSGTIRTTHQAVPRRRLGFGAKAGVTTAFAGVLALILTAAAFAAGQVTLGRAGAAVGIGAPGVLRALLGAVLCLVAVALVGLGLGSLARSTAVALAATVALTFLAWPVARALEHWSTLPDRLLIANAADALVTTRPVLGLQAARVPSVSLAVLTVCGQALLLLALGLWRWCRD